MCGYSNVVAVHSSYTLMHRYISKIIIRFQLLPNNKVVIKLFYLLKVHIAISWQEQVNFQRDEDDVRFVLDQHA